MNPVQLVDILRNTRFFVLRSLQQGVSSRYLSHIDDQSIPAVEDSLPSRLLNSDDFARCLILC